MNAPVPDDVGDEEVVVAEDEWRGGYGFDLLFHLGYDGFQLVRRG